MFVSILVSGIGYQGEMLKIRGTPRSEFESESIA